MQSSLFESETNAHQNILPYNGEVYYYGRVIDFKLAQHYFNLLMTEIDWRNDEAIIFGKKITTAREVAWYGDKPFDYTYSNTTKKALPWTNALLELKKLVESQSNETYNSCLLNLYHSGEEGMAWHSDGEIDLKKNGAIASVSLGAERKFSFKHKQTNEKIDIYLPSGSLLIMKGVTQSFWLHRLPPTKKINLPRINLTFRTIEK